MAEVLVLEISYRGSEREQFCDCFVSVYGDDQTLRLTQIRAHLPSNGVDLGVFVRGVSRDIFGAGQIITRPDRAVQVFEAADPIRAAELLSRRPVEKGLVEEEIVDLRADDIMMFRSIDGTWVVVLESGQSPILVTGDWGSQRVTPEPKER